MRTIKKSRTALTVKVLTDEYVPGIHQDPINNRQ